MTQKNQISHFKTLLKSRVSHQINNRSTPEILQECGSSCDVTTAQQSLSYASGSADDPIVLQDDDNDYSHGGSGGNNEFTDIEKKILTSDTLPKSLVID